MGYIDAHQGLDRRVGTGRLSFCRDQVVYDAIEEFGQGLPGMHHPTIKRVPRKFQCILIAIEIYWAVENLRQRLEINLTRP